MDHENAPQPRCTRWWKASHAWRFEITPVEVLKETSEMLIVLEKSLNGEKESAIRVSKRSRETQYFTTWKDAHEFLLKVAEGHLLAARRDLERAQSLHGHVKGLKAPADAADESSDLMPSQPWNA